MKKGMSGHYPLSAIRYPLLTAVAVVLLTGCAPSPEELMQRASTSLEKGDARSATIDLKALLQKEPQNASARAMLGEALAASGDIAGAEIELKKAADLGVTKATVLVPSCRVLLAQAKYDQVLADCKPEAGTPEHKFNLQILTGNALLGSGRAAEAKAVFANALSAKPDSIEALLGAAGAAQATDGPQAAKAVFNGASPALKDTAEYWLALAGLEAGMGDLAAAEAAYKTAGTKIKGAPDSPQRMMALGGLAEVQMRQGNVKAADETSAKLMKIAPNHPLAKQLRAQVAAAGGKTDEARTLLEDVVSKQPNNWDARTLLAIVNVQQGNMDQAQMHLQAVVANQPQNARAQRLLAEVRAKLETPEETLAGLKSALDETSNDPMMLAMAGRLSLASGDKAQAIKYLAAASEPGANADLQTKLDVANGYLVAGEIDRALEVLEGMPADGVAGKQRDALLLLTLLRKGDQPQLLAECKAVLERSPKDAATRNLVGGVYAATGKQDLAREQFNTAVKLAPDDPAGSLNLARLDLVQGKPAAAEAGFKRVLDKDPKNLTATLGMAITANARKDTKSVEKYLTKARDEHPDSVEAILGLAQFHLQQNDPSKARAVVDAAAKANPKSAAIANARGLVQMGSKDMPSAIVSFEAANRLEPANTGYATTLAQARLANGDVNGAFGVVDNLLKAQPKSASALAFASAMALRAGQLERATGYVERLRQLAPGAPETFALEGDLSMAQKRYKDALASYRKASAQRSGNQLVLAEYRAATLAGEQKPEKVLQDWLARNPGEVAVTTALAELRHGQGKNQEAIALYESALVKAPDNVVLLNNAAVLYDQMGNPKAVEMAGRAYKLQPNAAAIADTYGWIVFKQGKIEVALPPLRMAAKGLPDNAEVQYHLAAALAKSGDKAGALTLVSKAVKGSLPPDQKADAQKLLSELSK